MISKNKETAGYDSVSLQTVVCLRNMYYVVTCVYVNEFREDELMYISKECCFKRNNFISLHG